MLYLSVKVNILKKIEYMQKIFLSEKYNALELLTPMEQQVIAGTISEAGAMNATWKYESLWVLLWALGIVEELSSPMRFAIAI